MTAAEDALLVKAGIIGAACGLTLAAVAYGIARTVLDRITGR